MSAAVSIAREAGALLLEGLSQQKTIERKSSSVDWVTQYDKAAEEFIFTRLKALYPNHGFVGEEGTQVEGEDGFAWYVDPIDGTNNYAHSFPIFCVSIALYRDEQPLLGIIYDPNREDCFTAVFGQGANLTNGRNERRSLRVTEESQLGSSLLATGFPYDRQTNPDNNIRQTAAFLRTAQGVRRPGSAALDMAYVAAGRLDGFWEYKLNSWDMAAACLIVTEAGGKVSFTDGSPLKIQPKLDLVVSNGRIHQQMLDVIREA